MISLPTQTIFCKTEIIFKASLIVTACFFYNNIYKYIQIVTSKDKKLTDENKIIQLAKPKKKHHPKLISGTYVYGEVLHIISDISNTNIRKS